MSAQKILLHDMVNAWLVTEGLDDTAENYERGIAAITSKSTPAFVPTTADEIDRARVHTIDVTRYKLYALPARPGFAWRWEYNYSTDGSESCDWGTSLVELRAMFKRRYPNAHVKIAWKAE